MLLTIRNIICLLFILLSGMQINAQSTINELQSKIESQEMEIQSLRNQINNESENRIKKIDNYAPLGIVLFLFGGFCALWAQNTGRNAWLWFFAGMIFNVIAVIYVLVKNNDSL